MTYRPYTREYYIHHSPLLDMKSGKIWLCHDPNCSVNEVCKREKNEHVGYTHWGWYRSFDAALAKVVKARAELQRINRKVDAANGTPLEQAMMAAIAK